MSFWQALMTSPILQMALLGALAASISAGIVGSYVVVKRISFISGSLSHAVLSGMGLFLWLERTQGITWLSPIYGAVLSALLFACCIGFVHLRYREREDAIITALWALGMAVGILFVSRTPGYNLELMSFLLGNILWTSRADLIILLVLDVIVLVAAIGLHNRLLTLCFDEDQARLQKVPVRGLYLLLLVLVALTVVLLIQVVGIVLVMAMLTLPPMVAALFAKRLGGMIALSVLLGLIFAFCGVWLSYVLDWPTGATIALVAGAAYIATLVWQKS